MKTAMQLLYEDLEGVSKLSLTVSVNDILRAIGNHYLTIEKKQIVDAWLDGGKSVLGAKNATQYYNNTFKQESKEEGT